MKCSCCSSINVRNFFGTFICESCSEEIDYVCSDCGGFDHIVSDEGVTMCIDCRSVEAVHSVDWCEGKEVYDE